MFDCVYFIFLNSFCVFDISFEYTLYKMTKLIDDVRPYFFITLNEKGCPKI